jgi:hypothetical protein
MNEGFNTSSVEPNETVEEAVGELTVDQESKLEELFPEGPQTEDERLLFNRIVLEMATNPEGFDVAEVKEAFLKERDEVLSQGGFDDKSYSVENATGIVTPGDPLEQFKENQ